jgi:hypothetical protein
VAVQHYFLCPKRTVLVLSLRAGATLAQLLPPTLPLADEWPESLTFTAPPRRLQFYLCLCPSSVGPDGGESGDAVVPLDQVPVALLRGTLSP